LKNDAIPGEANHVLQQLISSVNGYCGDLVRGIYLTGSIPLGDFQHGKSDIDFLILLRDAPDQILRLKLSAMHQQLESRFPHTRLNGTYLPEAGIMTVQPPDLKCLYYLSGALRQTAFDMEPITLLELQTSAITLQGTPAHALSLNVQPDRVRAFMYNNINTYWKRFSVSPAKRMALCLAPQLTEWIILGMARQLYTLETCLICSKTSAGNYLLAHAPARFRPIIIQAMSIRAEARHHSGFTGSLRLLKPSIRRAQQTIACGRMISTLFNERYQLLLKGTGKS
jgi:hypothetical protein